MSLSVLYGCVCLTLEEYYKSAHGVFHVKDNPRLDSASGCEILFQRAGKDSDLPLNFLGGFVRSPASGCTTHLSSTNLQKQPLLDFISLIYMHMFFNDLLRIKYWE